MPAPAAKTLCLVSACLCGVPCRYDAKPATVPHLVELHRRGLALAVCPEIDGGLSAPRPPCELRGGRVVTHDGTDLTEQFQTGAAHVVKLALEHGISLAILKENSPSCGSTMIYDGKFSGQRIPGQGITAALLRGHGIRVVSEHTFQEALSCHACTQNPGVFDAE